MDTETVDATALSQPPAAAEPTLRRSGNGESVAEQRPGFITRVPLGLRIALAFLLPLVTIVALGLVALFELNQATHRFARFANDDLERLDHIQQVGTALAEIRALELEHLMTDDPGRRARAAVEIESYQQSLRNSLTAYEARLGDRSRMMSLPLLQARYSAYSEAHTAIMSLSAQGRRDEALALYNQTETAYHSLLVDTESLRQQELMEVQGAAHEGYTVGVRSREVLIGGLVVAVGLLFAVGLWFTGYVRRRLMGLLDVIKRVAQRDFSHPLDDQGSDEFGTLARAFNVMTSSLKEAEEENRGLYAESLTLKEERIGLLQEALRRSVEVQENERHRIARELHDQVGQSLAILQLTLSRLQKAAPTPEAAETLSQVREMALETLKQVRQVSLDLRPGMLDDAGLVSTLREYGQSFAERAVIAVEVSAGDWESPLPSELEVTVFRIVQEAMTNIAKHARASRVRIVLDRSAETLELRVQDDGVGFDIEEALKGQRRKSLGLFGMEERCRLSGGRVEIDSRPGEGTEVVCRWQLTATAAV